MFNDSKRSTGYVKASDLHQVLYFSANTNFTVIKQELFQSKSFTSSKLNLSHGMNNEAKLLLNRQLIPHKTSFHLLTSEDSITLTHTRHRAVLKT